MISHTSLFILAILMLCSCLTNAQTPDLNDMTKEQRDAYFAKIREASEADHKRMMTLLNIDSIRPGANGSDPNAPNAANYDESKANPFPELPDPLITNAGKKVTSAKAWWNVRRPEIVEAFDREIYGRVPANVPAVKWEITNSVSEDYEGIPVVKKTLIGHVDNSSYPQITVDIQLTLVTPANAKVPVPVIMEFGFIRPSWFPPPNPAPAGPSWQRQVLDKGWGYASLIPTSIQPDNGAGLTQGIIGLVNKGKSRTPEDWGSLRAWAWGASRAMDYFETDTNVNASRIGIQGHSRYGKATAVTMAYDNRFAIAYISSCGEGGAKINRRNFGEIIENVAGVSEYHWMAGNFIKYAGPLNGGDLPVDGHSLLALCAPRPIFLGTGDQGDWWVDAKGQFLAAVHAGPVYRLLGKDDLGTTHFPPMEKAIIDGDIGFRQHKEGHTPAPNWPTFLSFAEKYLR